MTRARLALTGLAAALALTFATALWQIATQVAGPEPPRRSAVGEERPIGGFDPHLMVALTEVERPDALPGLERAPDGVYVVLTLRARSDAAEIVVDPGELDIYVEGNDGAIYRPLELGAFRARFEPGGLPPGGVRLQRFAFELPRDRSGLELWVSAPTWLSALLPGGRDSRLFQKLVVPLG